MRFKFFLVLIFLIHFFLFMLKNENCYVFGSKNPSSDHICSNYSSEKENCLKMINMADRSQIQSNLNAKLICVEKVSAVLAWNITNFQNNFTLEIILFKITKNDSLLDLYRNNHIDKNTATAGEYFFKTLTSNSVYRALLVKIENEKVAKNDWASIDFRTSSEDEFRLPPQWFNVTQLIPQNGSFTNAIVQWNYSPKNTPCTIMVSWWSNFTNYVQRKRIKKSWTNQAILSDLLYDTPYYIWMRTENDDAEIKELKITYNTPSCHVVVNNSSICRIGQKIHNILIERFPLSSKCNVNVSWTMQNFIPDYYTILFEQLQPLKKNILMKNITGNMTYFTQNEVDMGICSNVHIIAYKYNDFREAVEKNCIVELAEENKFQLILFYFILTFILFLFLFWSLIKLQRRKTKDNNMKKYYQLRIINKKLIKMEIEGERNVVETEKYQVLLGEMLGRGAFGIVYKGTLTANKKKPIEVAVKTLQDNATAKEIQQFEKEISLMSDVGFHNNIVSLIATFYHDKHPLLIVEFCPLGDLHTYLCEMKKKLTDFSNFDSQYQHLATIKDDERNSKYMVQNKIYGITTKDVVFPELTFCDLLSFGRQVAIGMNYLASNYVVHRDLAARNVLLCTNKTVKISDFGLSRDIYAENIYRKLDGSELMPIKWMALESISRQEYTTQSDVWSFGIFLWELFSMGDEPYPNIFSPEVLYLQLKNGYRMSNPCPDCPDLFAIMLNCWLEDPNLRPQFSTLYHNLDEMLNSCSPHDYISVTGEDLDG